MDGNNKSEHILRGSCSSDYYEMEALARVLLPEILAFFESEEGQREYAEWMAKKQAEQENEA